jgi:hypothetical protein
MVNVGIFYDQLEYFMAIWYSLWSFVIFFPIWNVCTKKNLATLIHASLRNCFWNSRRSRVVRVALSPLCVGQVCIYSLGKYQGTAGSIYELVASYPDIYRHTYILPKY